MSLNRIRPAGWPTTPTTSEGWLTAAELNALDIDHTKAVDKMNGDTIAGPIVLMGPPQPWLASAAHGLGEFAIPIAPSALLFECTTAGTSAGTEPTWPTTIGATVTDGSVVWTAMAPDTQTPNGGWTFGGPVVITGAGSTLKTQNGGRIEIGANDLGVPYWPQYSPPRALLRTQPFLVQLGAGFHWVIDNNHSIANDGPGQIGNADITRSLVDGSTLTAIDIYFAVGQAHANSPATGGAMPSFTLFNQGFGPNDRITLATGTIPDPGSGAAWYAAGAVQHYTLLVPSVVIDRSNGSYYVQVVDESGPNAHNLNIFQSLRFNYTVSDMRPA